jgi:hypothetical protein
VEPIGSEADHTIGAGQVGALAAAAPGPWQLEAIRCKLWGNVVCQSNLLLRLASRDFVAIEKPFTLAILVAINTHQAATARHTEHLDHRPHLAQKLRNSPQPLPNLNPLPDVEFALLWLCCYPVHSLFSFLISTAGSQSAGCSHYQACIFNRMIAERVWLGGVRLTSRPHGPVGLWVLDVDCVYTIV